MKYLFALFVFFVSFSLSAQLIINELMTNNVSAHWDDAYNYSMWVELYNPSPTSVNQSNFFLSDNPEQPRKWQLPVRTITARGYSVLWMEREERANHAPFRLNPEGGVLYLFNASGVVIDYLLYPAQYRNASYGRFTDGAGEWVFFEAFSAGSSNNGKTIGSGKCNAPVVTLPGGFYTGSASIRFETPAAGDTIYYNLNSNEPGRSTSIRYIPGNTITINSTTILRAKTFSNGKLASDISTASYLFNQRNFNLPVVSLVTPSAYLDNNTYGIYVAGTNGITGNGETTPKNWNQDWDRPANFEFFDRQRTGRLNQEIDIKIGGGWSRMNPQKTLHVMPKKKFGNNKLAYPFFSSKPHTVYKDITLRNSGNDFYYSMMRDGMMQSLIIGRMDIEYLAYEPAVLFVNGMYYGIQNLRERSNADLLYTQYGLSEEDIYLLDTYTYTGHPDYQQMNNHIFNNDITRADVYDQLHTMMDVKNYIDYMLTQIYLGNYDWPHNNVKIWKKKTDGKWRWILYDTDFGFNLYDGSLHTFNSLTYALGENTGKPTQEWATRFFSRLMLNESFRNQFIDRFSIHLSSTFTTPRVNYIIDSLAAPIRNEIAFHKGRWTSYRTFDSDIATMKTFSTNRAVNMLNFIRARFLNNAAIQSLTISSNIPQANYLFNNQPIADGSISLQSFNGRPFTLTANKVKGYTFKHWELNSTMFSTTAIPWDSEWRYWDSGSIPAVNWFSEAYSDVSWKTGQAQLGYGAQGMKTTIGFGPDANNKYPTAYFRKSFTLTDASTVNSATVRVFADDGAAVYVNGVEIGRYNLPAGTLTFNTFTTTWNNGEYVDFTIPGSLLRNGPNLVAVEVHQTSANSSDLLFNLEMKLMVANTGDNVYTNATISAFVSPGQTFKAIYEEDGNPDPLSGVKVFINEIVASNSEVRDEYGDKDDYIELYNAGNTAVDISGWYLSDKQGFPMKWQLPADPSAVVPSGGFLVLWADEQPHQGALHLDFKLSATGEYLSLSAENKYGTIVLIDSVQFPALANNLSYSRIPDGGSNWQVNLLTPRASNLSTRIDANTGSRINVYPTLFSDKITIENAAGNRINIYDIAGKQIMSVDCNEPVFRLNTTQLAKGMYILRINSHNFSIIK